MAMDMNNLIPPVVSESVSLDGALISDFSRSTRVSLRNAECYTGRVILDIGFNNGATVTQELFSPIADLIVGWLMENFEHIPLKSFEWDSDGNVTLTLMDGETKRLDIASYLQATQD